MATSLITLEEAKDHLYIVDGTHDDDVQRKIEQASGIIIDYLKVDTATVATWAAGTVEVPGPVKAAAMVMLTHLHENRGDNMKPDEDAWKAIERLLMRSRDPALA